jgi:hypothetical protein
MVRCEMVLLMNDEFSHSSITFNDDATTTIVVTARGFSTKDAAHLAHAEVMRACAEVGVFFDDEENHSAAKQDEGGYDVVSRIDRHDRPIQPGDVVRMKSGGLHKTVASIDDDGIATCYREVERCDILGYGRYTAVETEKHPVATLERVS